MARRHIFRASGDNCPICLALDGHEVSPGFTPHPGCTCETIAVETVGDCVWDFQDAGNQRDGSAPTDVILGFAVTVTCPDGSEIGASGQIDLHPYPSGNTFDDDAWMGAVTDAAEELAQELCAQCQG